MGSNNRSSASRPVIAVTVGVPARAPDPLLARRKNELYAAAIRRAGGDPVLVDAAMGAAERRAVLSQMDGLLLGGGADIDPAWYGEAPGGARDTEPDRDRLEHGAWNEAEERELPVLGICRGLQTINVFAGGRLVQDVAGHAGAPFGHGFALRHPLRLEPGFRLARILLGDAERTSGAAGDGRHSKGLEVNSYHHQGVTADRLAPGLIATAWAPGEPSDLVEGVELPGERFVVGVQCHPERPESTPSAFEALWAAFVRAARRDR